MNWVVVVPVKGNPGAKSRLSVLPERAALADAFALDTVSALLASSGVLRVLVVTGDAVLGATLRLLGAAIVPEPTAADRAHTSAHVPDAADKSDAPDDPLNAAIREGVAAARAEFPDAPVAVVTGDLPTLCATDVEDALALAAVHQLSMVSDTQGTGTTVLLAAARVPFTPRFGLDSRAAHEAAGHTPLHLSAESSIRFDVDTPADLALALQRGVGRYTAAASASRWAASPAS